MNNKKHRSNTVFFVTQNPQLNTQPQVSTNTLRFFERLRKGYLPCFSPRGMTQTRLNISSLCFFLFWQERRFDCCTKNEQEAETRVGIVSE